MSRRRPPAALARLPDATVAVLVAALLVATVATVAVASPPPTAVCGLCGDQFEEAADEAGVPVTVERSTVTIQVHDDGSASWTIRNVLADPASLDDGESSLPAVVDAMPDYRRLVGDRTDYRTRLDGGTAIVAFETPDLARRATAGTLLVDALHSGASGGYVHFEGDRLAVHGPDGYSGATPPDGATVEDGAVVWAGDFDSGFLVFAPGDGPAAAASAHLAISVATAGLVLPSFLRIAPVPLAVLAAALVGLAVRDRRSMGRRNRRRLAGGVALVGLLVAVTPVVGGPVLPGTDAVHAGLGLGYAALGALAARVQPGLSTRRLAAAMAVGPVVSAVASVLLVDGDSAARLVGLVAFVAAVGLFLLFGHAVGGRTGRRWPTAAGILGGVAIASLPFFPAGRLSFAAFLGTLGLAVFAVLFGWPLFVLGYSMADDDRSGDRTSRPAGE